MDELPGLLVEAIGDATVVETVDVGGGDVVAVTVSETHLYRSDGLLSDETVESFDHDVEGLSVEPGRRKHRIRLSGVDGTRELTVPAKTAAAVVAAMLEGVLRTGALLADDETVSEVFRFSDLTLVVTDEQLLKHVGAAVWNEDHEAFPYADLSALDFEEGSVNTQVIVRTDDRGERVKVPNDHAPRVREAIQTAVFEYHGVSSLGGLRAKINPDPEADPDGTGDGTAADDADGGDAGDGTGEDEDDATAVGGHGEGDATSADAGVAATDDGGSGGLDDDGFVSADWSPPADQDITGPRGRVDADGGDGAGGSSVATDASATSAGAGDVDLATLAGQVEALAEQVEHQSEQLEAQRETIEQLVAELRRGR